jgi:hypothetical protein
MHNFNYSPKQLSLVTAILFMVSIGYSAYASSQVRTPKLVCSVLQTQGLIKNCREGTPWAFEVMRHQEEYSFEPTSSEIFKCYTVSDGHTHVPCVFKGAIKQFENQADLHAGLEQIRQQNYRKHNQADLDANMTRADTTLEHYIFYKSNASHILVILPVTDGMSTLLKVLEQLGLEEVDE